jgi:hypothetical protein
LLFALFMVKGALVSTPRDVVSEFDAERAEERLARILGDERPHPVDSAANDAVRERILAEIGVLGYAPEIRDDFSCRAAARRGAVACARVRNISFRAGPTAGPAIIVASHYDSVPAGPGAADDGAGLAASLEIAAILAKRRPVKPVIFLITDGEEAGLLGAASFMRNDPLADDIGAVVNMEARGVKGPALMFETSAPNGRDVAALAERTRRPFANSLATDVYRLMPNDTDMTEFLTSGADALNFAIIGGSPFYHTPHDNLANLDRASLAHLGATALSGVDGFLAATPGGKERSYIFSDVFGRSLILLPTLAGLLLSMVGLGAAAFVFLNAKPARPLRVAAAPLAGAAIAGALALAGLSFVDLARAETSYWYATPAAARAVIYMAAICGAAFMLLFMAKSEERRAVRAAGWFWFSLIGVVAAALLPGASILFAVPAALFACATLAAAGASRLLPVFATMAVAGAFMLILPALQLFEEALGLGVGWAPAILASLLSTLGLSLATGAPSRPSFVAMVLAAAFAGAVVLAATVDAYSPSAPRPLNIQHVVVADTGEAFFSLSPAGGEPPRAMAAAADFKSRDIKGLEGARLAAPAPKHDGAAVGVDIVSEVVAELGRTVVVNLTANGADEIVVGIPEEAALAEAWVGGEKFSFGGKGAKTIRCSGRSCATFRVAVVVDRIPAEWKIYGVRHGLGAVADAVRAARPASATPIQSGDVRLVVSVVKI